MEERNQLSKTPNPPTVDHDSNMATFPLPRAAESKYSANRFRHKSSYVTRLTRFQYNSIESQISLALSHQSVPIKYNLV